jgi:hypothetical protein
LRVNHPGRRYSAVMNPPAGYRFAADVCDQ